MSSKCKPVARQPALALSRFSKQPSARLVFDCVRSLELVARAVAASAKTIRLSASAESVLMRPTDPASSACAVAASAKTIKLLSDAAEFILLIPSDPASSAILLFCCAAASVIIGTFTWLMFFLAMVKLNLFQKSNISKTKNKIDFWLPIYKKLNIKRHNTIKYIFKLFILNWIIFFKYSRLCLFRNGSRCSNIQKPGAQKLSAQLLLLQLCSQLTGS